MNLFCRLKFFRKGAAQGKGHMGKRDQETLEAFITEQLKAPPPEEKKVRNS